MLAGSCAAHDPEPCTQLPGRKFRTGVGFSYAPSVSTRCIGWVGLAQKITAQGPSEPELLRLR